MLGGGKTPPRGAEDGLSSGKGILQRLGLGLGRLGGLGDAYGPPLSRRPPQGLSSDSDRPHVSGRSPLRIAWLAGVRFEARARPHFQLWHRDPPASGRVLYQCPHLNRRARKAEGKLSN
jgi:hypothetical protein